MTTFLLIPGAGGAAWCWHRVAALLRAAGHEAIAVDLQGEEGVDLPEYARQVISAIGDQTDVVLVAHSLGGFTAPLVAAKVPVSALVLVNAMIPSPCETPAAWWGNTGSEQARLAAAERGGYPSQIDLDVYFLHDIAPKLASALAAHDRPEPDSVFESASDFEAWPPVPIRVVAGADDRLFPAGFQQALARDRLGITADMLPGGHLMALSQPAALAAYLEQAASPGV
jgi:pimeloyl-ACP methyl ester carboxylesterase